MKFLTTHAFEIALSNDWRFRATVMRVIALILLFTAALFVASVIEEKHMLAVETGVFLLSFLMVDCFLTLLAWLRSAK